MKAALRGPAGRGGDARRSRLLERCHAPGRGERRDPDVILAPGVRLRTAMGPRLRQKDQIRRQLAESRSEKPMTPALDTS
jgi:hypothetical protein